MCKLMKQRLINDELQYQLESYYFSGLFVEQQSLIFAIIKLTKRNLSILYKKCNNLVTLYTESESNKRPNTTVYLKDLL